MMLDRLMPETAGAMTLNHTNYEQVQAFASALPLNLTNMKENYTLARQHAENALISRNLMPRLEDADVTELRAFLGVQLLEVIKICDNTLLPARLLKPVQENIYVDKVLHWIHKNLPVEQALKHESYSHIFIDGNFHIIDGHHRWLSIMLMNPLHVPRVYVIQSDIGHILETLRNFTKVKGRKPNA